MTITSYATLVDPIRARAATAPDWPGVVLMHEDGAREIITAADLWSDVLSAATGLRNAGLHPDDVVILIMGHSHQLITTFLGAMALGAVPTIVSTATARLDLEVYRKRIDVLVRCAAAAAVITHPADAIPLHEYHRRPELTRAAFRDRWFRTGDLGYLVGGELYVVGRQSDLIIVVGRNIAPEEIEAAAEQVPGVVAGRAVAFGVADERAGTERVILICETAQPDDAVHQIALERQLRRMMTQALEITLGEVRMVERGWIIKTSSGKKARSDNRDKYRRQFGSAPEAIPR